MTGFDARIGTDVAGFRVESLIGQGAMGAVYLAEDARAGRRVALKLLVPELSDDDRFRRRFLREARIAATLDHAHVVRTVAWGEEDGLLYLAMAYIEGSDLRELLLSTGDVRLVESATVDNEVNRLWGEVNGSGKNMLGVLLMEIREELGQDVEGYLIAAE